MTEKHKFNKHKKAFYIIIVFLIAVAVILVSSTLSKMNVYWYVSLIKPLHPPYYIYLGGWSVLFILISISAVMVLSAPDSKREKSPLAIPLYLVNAFLVCLYTALFFGLRAVTVAFIEAILIIASIILMIEWNYKISKPAAYLLIPYLLWIIYCLVLNGLILFAN